MECFDDWFKVIIIIFVDTIDNFQKWDWCCFSVGDCVMVNSFDGSIESLYKTVWQTLITSCYKEFIDSLTKWLTLYCYWFSSRIFFDLLFNILYTPCNFQRTLKTIKSYKLLGSIWESAISLCMDYGLKFYEVDFILFSEILKLNDVLPLSILSSSATNVCNVI